MGISLLNAHRNERSRDYEEKIRLKKFVGHEFV